MKVFCVKYPRNTVTDILLSLLCIFIISLILINGKYKTESVFVDDNQIVYDFIENYGWLADYSECEKTSVNIPYIFDDVYKDYNVLQMSQGFDLEGYKGRAVLKYTYRLLNFPEYENDDNVFINVLLSDGVIIGADILSTSINGFITGVVR